MNVHDMPEVHRRALDATGGIVAGIRSGQWTAGTPCDGWDVRTLTNHLVAGNLWAGQLAAGRTIEEVGADLDGDVLGDDPPTAYANSANEAAAAFEAPGALEATCAVSYGPVPGSVYAGHRIIDVLVHGWDLATATGQASELDPELVSASLAIVEPQLDALRSSGAFGRTMEPPAGVDQQTRLLIMLGRTEVG
jgi:uncharacterized protein (TIGR03086 family)